MVVVVVVVDSPIAAGLAAAKAEHFVRVEVDWVDEGDGAVVEAAIAGY